MKTRVDFLSETMIRVRHIPDAAGPARPGLVVPAYPEATGVDFHSGERHQGGQILRASAPRERIPLFVRAGTVLPLGEPMQWHDEKPDAQVELRVYPAADASFNLYQDAGDGDGYTRGEYRLLKLGWDESGKSFTVDTVGAGFPGMPESATFRLQVVGNDPRSFVFKAQGEPIREDFSP